MSDTAWKGRRHRLACEYIYRDQDLACNARAMDIDRVADDHREFSEFFDFLSTHLTRVTI
jgi:hypothetical protein